MSLNFFSTSSLEIHLEKNLKLFIINNTLSENNIQLHKPDLVTYGTEHGKILCICLKRCIQRTYRNKKNACRYEKEQYTELGRISRMISNM